MKFRILLTSMVTADGERFGRAEAHWLEVPIDAETKAEAAALFGSALAHVAALSKKIPEESKE